MPRFVLDTFGTVHGVRAPSIEAVKRVDLDFMDMDAFTRGYIEALFFTECEIGVPPEDHDPETQSSLPDGIGFDALAPDALARIVDDCHRFQEINADTLALAYASPWDGSKKWGAYDASMAGHDFWFTRNGHGVGFWSRGLGDVGDRLDAACGWRTPFAEVNPYMGDDGKVHLD